MANLQVMRSILWKLTINCGLLVSWLVLVYAMYRNYYFVNPPLPNQSDSVEYGRNWEGGLYTYTVLSLVEVVLLYIVLRPWSFRCHLWWRFWAAVPTFGFWTFILLFAAMHQSSLYVIHLFWAMFVSAMLLVVGFFVFAECNSSVTKQSIDF